MSKEYKFSELGAYAVENAIKVRDMIGAQCDGVIAKAINDFASSLKAVLKAENINIESNKFEFVNEDGKIKAIKFLPEEVNKNAPDGDKPA
jgi:hypothetical protein